MGITNTNFDKLMKDVKKLEKKAGFDKTSEKQLISWLEEEIKNYRDAKTNIIKRNKLIDILMLSMQIAIRRDWSLDNAWKRWWWKSQKYLKEK